MRKILPFASVCLLLLSLLVACGTSTMASGATVAPSPATTATSIPSPTASPTSTSTPSPTNTATPTLSPTRMPSPTATAVPPTPTVVRTIATDSDKLCQMAIPAGFAEDSPGSGYFPALDSTGFVALDSPDTAGGANTFDQALATVLANLATVLPGYQETGVTRSPGSLRVDFVATLDDGPGKGTAYFKEFGPIVCGGTLFLTQRATAPFDSTLQAMIASLQAVKGAQPRPTATLPPPTPTARPKQVPQVTPTSVPRTAAADTWRGAPVYPNSSVYEEQDQSIVYLVAAPARTVQSWYERTWAAAGMTFLTTYEQDDLIVYVYMDGDTFYGFTVADAGSGITVVGLICIQ